MTPKQKPNVIFINTRANYSYFFFKFAKKILSYLNQLINDKLFERRFVDMIISGFEAVLHTKILPKIRQNFFALKLYGTVVIVLQPEIAFFSQNRGGSSAHLGPQRFATQKRGANRVGQQPEPVTGLSPYPTRLLTWLKSLANGESVTRSLQILT